MRIFLLLVCIFSIVGCDDKNDAPFGYQWGMSPYSVKSAGSSIYTESEEKNGVIVTFTSSVPENGFSEGFYRQYFKNKKLNKIVYNTYDISGDKDNGIIKYSELKNKLIEQYGTPIEVNEHISNTSFNFYPCIQNSNCGAWESKFNANNYTIRIYLGMGNQGDSYGDDRQKGSVYIEYIEK
ncbi:MULTISPECIES: hypothetical protein [Yersinia pseudotuberculosis complex]|uniref:hypothetical protein n=1 Tax=Yersinia pseudotuberculosis complex TaxID=1649845 RepID=UPI00059B007A|nr:MULTISPECIES: hypothetical protein [Yersinia pseudotuberculosis complex]MCE4113230.1 hypothetical protein [Yersinia pseudotuberculosis]RYC26244.1 hypothetical protein EU971_11230 [Yersinia pseudotuberculosis]UFA64070.1 Uncharacterized protein YP598_4462 [Yersinia pseudotuberculosis]WLF06159.1 hypothetical protein Q6G25_21300 [Yersinia pseudotuberculosis]